MAILSVLVPHRDPGRMDTLATRPCMARGALGREVMMANAVAVVGDSQHKHDANRDGMSLK